MQPFRCSCLALLRVARWQLVGQAFIGIAELEEVYQIAVAQAAPLQVGQHKLIVSLGRVPSD